MIRAAILLLFSLCLFCYADAQLAIAGIPVNERDVRDNNITGYYHDFYNEIIIDIQKKDSITHFFYDTALVLKSQYSVATDDRTLKFKKDKQGYIQNICLPNLILEVYASDSIVSLYKLDQSRNVDLKIATIVLKQKYDDEKLVAVMPTNNGTNFLMVSLKKKKAIIYKWKLSSGSILPMEVELPSNTLSKEIIKEMDGDFVKVKYKDLFTNLSISKTNKPAVFEFPSLGQLFYNDSCMYIVNSTPYHAGINVFKIDTDKGIAASSNYLINKVEAGTQSKYLLYPVATIYDTLLIIQNCSQKIFEYYFYNLLSGKLIATYQTKVDNSLYNLVNGPLRQYGTFTSTSEEKEVENEKAFMRSRNYGLAFLKPVVTGDSMLLTFGSFGPSTGIEGVALRMATMNFGFGVVIGGMRFTPYMSLQRNMLLYGYSKFSMNGFQISKANNIRTYLDDFAADNRMKELANDNSVLIDLPGKLYIAVYNPKTKIFDLSIYQQH